MTRDLERVFSAGESITYLPFVYLGVALMERIIGAPCALRNEGVQRRRGGCSGEKRASSSVRLKCPRRTWLHSTLLVVVLAFQLASRMEGALAVPVNHRDHRLVRRALSKYDLTTRSMIMLSCVLGRFVTRLLAFGHAASSFLVSSWSYCKRVRPLD